MHRIVSLCSPLVQCESEPSATCVIELPFPPLRAWAQPARGHLIDGVSCSRGRSLGGAGDEGAPALADGH
jgi:hypothetical protein